MMGLLQRMRTHFARCPPLLCSLILWTALPASPQPLPKPGYNTPVRHCKNCGILYWGYFCPRCKSYFGVTYGDDLLPLKNEMEENEDEDDY